MRQGRRERRPLRQISRAVKNGAGWPRAAASLPTPSTTATPATRNLDAIRMQSAIRSGVARGWSCEWNPCAGAALDDCITLVSAALR